MKNKRIRNTFISIFVIAWLLLFHYESARHFYLNPWFKKTFDKELPKTKFLFPPAGWIMFFNVSDRAGYVEVYGVRNGKLQLIDPHDILQTRTIGYDNVHRGILGAVSRQHMAKPFCGYLRRKFPQFDKYAVVYALHPNLTKDRFERREKVLYQCAE